MLDIQLTDWPKLIWRRKYWVLIPTVLSFVGALVVLRQITPMYRASTVVMVEPQKVPSDYVKTTVTVRLEDRLKTLEQRLTRRANMERIIEEANLYADRRASTDIEDLVDEVRRNLRVVVQRGSLIRIYFTGQVPTAVALAANRIADLFIEENLRLREQQAQSTTSFLVAELTDMKQLLEVQEKIVSEYRLSNAGSLPEQRGANVAALGQLEAKLQVTQAEIERLEMRRVLLERDSKPGTGVVSAPSSIYQRVQELRLELQKLESRYTDRHPDVIRLRKEIELLQRRAATDPEVQVEEIPTDPVYQVEIRSIELEINRLHGDQQRYLDDIEKYQNRLERTPRVEQELISLTRDYDNLGRGYQSLLSKRIEARLAEDLERQRQSEQFEILERAVPPEYPYFPNTLFTLSFGGALGLALGLGLAFIREGMDETLNSESALREAFPGVPVVVAIPRLAPASQEYVEDAAERDAKTA